MIGKFISLEGSDGSGKSTQLQKIKDYFINKNIEAYYTREPGGTDISEKIRDLLLDKDNKSMDYITEMLLYSASRRQHISEIILPKLNDGITIVSDRFFHSSIAYQGYGRNLLNETLAVNDIVTDGLVPDLTIYLHLPIENSIKRKTNEENHELDRMELENIEYFERVYNGFNEIYKNDKYNILRIDATKSIDEVFAEIEKTLDKLFA